VYFILVDKRIFIKFLNFILPYDVIETIRIKKNNIKAFKLKCFILLKKQDMWIKKNIKQIKIEHLLYFDKIGKAEFIDFLIFLLFVLK